VFEWLHRWVEFAGCAASRALTLRDADLAALTEGFVALSLVFFFIPVVFFLFITI